MRVCLRGAIIVVALMGGAGFAIAADNAAPNSATRGDTHGNEPPSSLAVGANGAVPVGPIGASGDTMPAKYSAQNDADDKLPLGGYRLKHLTQAQRQEIYRSVRLESSPATMADDTVHPAVGNLVPAAAVLWPLPDAVTAQVPYTKDLKFVPMHDKVVLVDPVSRMVVGVLPD
jgi:hypothetical protein